MSISFSMFWSLIGTSEKEELIVPVEETLWSLGDCQALMPCQLLFCCDVGNLPGFRIEAGHRFSRDSALVVVVGSWLTSLEDGLRRIERKREGSRVSRLR